MRTHLTRLVLVLIAVFGITATAQAKGFIFDNGSAIDQDKPYDSAQAIDGVFDGKGVYGRVTSSNTVDIYKFTPDRDGDLSISLLDRFPVGERTVQPVLVLLDPTDATEDMQLPLPLPSDEYHATVVKEAAPDTAYQEVWLGQKYAVLAEQVVTLKKDQTYYLAVLEAYSQDASYVVKFGDDNIWGFGSVFTDFGGWVQLQLDAYSGHSPFHFSLSTFAFALFLLGTGLLAGIYLIQKFLAIASYRSKEAVANLAGIQRFSRVAAWLALWLVALGGYLHFSQVGFLGLPFLISVVYVVALIAFIWSTVRVSPRVAAVAHDKLRPLKGSLGREFWIVNGVAGVALLAHVVLLAIYLT